MSDAPRPAYPHELLTPKEMAQADRLAAALLPSATLMENAGAAIAASVGRLAVVDGGPVVVLCGPGNNGGDGYVAARRLDDAGFRVVLGALVPPDRMRGDAAEAARRWSGPVARLADLSFDGAAAIIDALFGAGLARDLEGEAAAVVDRVNAWRRTTRRPLVAVDIPSGIDGATGRTCGVAIAASHTVTFFRLKPGHALLPGRLHCGALDVVDIGLPTDVLETVRPRTGLNTPAAWLERLPRPSLAGHKYARGHAVVVSGPIGQTGAARLCARGALRAGAGLVTVATPAEALPIHAAALTAVMTRVADDADGLAALLSDPRKNVAAMGPGPRRWARHPRDGACRLAGPGEW